MTQLSDPDVRTPAAFNVSSSVHLMLLQGHLSSSLKPPEEPRQPGQSVPVDTSADSLSSVLASLESEGSRDCRVLLRRASACRQLGEDVEEERRLAEDALDLCRVEGGPPRPATPGGGGSASSSAPFWEVAALCAVAEAHLGVEDAREAALASEEALALCQGSGYRLGRAETLAVALKVHLLKTTSEEEKQVARDLLVLLRELGATWGEVATMLSVADMRVEEDGPESCSAEALVRAEAAREDESRWDLAQELFTAAIAHLHLDSREAALQTVNEFLTLSRELGVIQLQDSSDDATSPQARAAANIAAAEEQLTTGLPSDARRSAAAGLRILRDELQGSARHGEASALLALARAVLSQGAGRASEAFTSALHALTLFRQVGDRRGEGLALHAMAQTLLSEGSAGRAGDALQLCSEAGRLFCDVEERNGVASLLSTLSRAHLMLNSPEDALAAARDSLGTYQELAGQPDEGAGSSKAISIAVGEAEALLCLATAHVALNKPAESLTTAKEALEHIKGLLLKVGEGLKEKLLGFEGEALFVLLKAHIACGQLEEAMMMGTTLQERFRRSGQKSREADALKSLADVHLAKKEPAAARDAAHKALELFQELNNSTGEKDALQLVVSAELLGPDIGSAMQTAKQAVDRFKSEGDPRNEASALQTVARTHIAKKEFLRAARVAKEAQEILRQLQDTDGEIDMLQTAVEAHLSRPEADGKDDALQTCSEALTAFKRCQNLRGEALALGILAHVYIAADDPETAVCVVRDAVTLFRQLGDRKAESELLKTIINADLIPAAMESSDVALRAVKAALAVCHQCEDKKGQAVMLKCTFRILMAREKPERALQAAEEAIKLYKELEDKSGESELLWLSAQLLLSREEHRKALVAAQDAAILCRDAGDRVGEMAALQTAMDVHAARGEHQLALEASQEVLAICRHIQDPASEAGLLQRMCEVYLEQGGKENAEVVTKTAKQAHSLARSAGDLGAETAALAALGRAHLEAGRRQEAMEVTREAVRCANDSGDRRHQITALQAFGEVSLKLGHAFDALEAACEAMEYARFEGLVQQEAAALTTIVSARLANAEPSEALRAAKEAHDRAKRLGNSRSEAAALQAVASVCLHIRAPAEAIQALDGAQAHYKKLKDKKKEAAVVGQAVKAQLLAGDAVQALRAAKESRQLSREVRDKKGEAEALNAAAQVHTSNQDYSEAVDSAKSMMSIYDELGDNFECAKARHLLASLYVTKGDIRAGIEAGEDACVKFRNLEDPQSEVTSQHLVAQAYMQRYSAEQKSAEARGMQHFQSQDPKEAVRAALRARALAKQLGNQSKELEVLETLARAEIAKKDPREGLLVAEEYRELAKKARDKLSEANANLLCSSAEASQGRLPQALRSAEAAKTMFKDLGHSEGIAESERFVNVLQEHTRVNQSRGGYSRAEAAMFGGDARGPNNRFGWRRTDQVEEVSENTKGNGSLLTGKRGLRARAAPEQLYNRQAFPWTPQQASALDENGKVKPGI